MSWIMMSLSMTAVAMVVALLVAVAGGKLQPVRSSRQQESVGNSHARNPARLRRPQRNRPIFSMF